MKKYEIGMYGGKYMPFHLGHKYCLDVAAKECEKVYLILFIGGNDEIEIRNNSFDKCLTVEERKKKIFELSKEYDNVIPSIIDVTDCKYENGEEDWDMETPLVRNLLGNKLDAVYSSEISYGEYFKRAYPEAEHRLVDPPRINYPISGTKIRKMKKKEEMKKWMV